MSDYLYKKFYGKYRILAFLDNNTNDFPRDKNGNIDTDDFYIPCKGNAMIQHYGKDILTAFIPSTIKGNRLIKMCEENNIQISDIMEGDGEIGFRFKAKDIDFVADYLGAKTLGKDIRPFSIKNLPKSNYVIPLEDFEKYKEITAKVDKENILIISKVTNDFITERMQKRYKGIDIKKEMKKKCMARQIKEFIHSMGMWDEYLMYLSDNL